MKTEPLAIRWVPLALRGVAAIVFGGVVLAMPVVSLATLIVLFAAYSMTDGVFTLVGAVRAARAQRSWWVQVLNGVASLAFGVVTLMWPGLGALALLYMLAAWAVVTGVLEVAAAVELRKVIENEWLFALSGIASIVFGGLLFTSPVAGALAVVMWIGAYGIAFGALLVALSLRLRSWSHSHPLVSQAHAGA